MTQYQRTIKTNAPWTLGRIQPGQWIDYEGARGRWMGVSRTGTVWIAWSETATKRFKDFAEAYRGVTRP